jgi:hypothetical protein
MTEANVFMPITGKIIAENPTSINMSQLLVNTGNLIFL